MNVGGIIPFSLAVQGNLYAHVGDAGSEPNTIDSNGFWVYHNANATCWFSAILVF